MNVSERDRRTTDSVLFSSDHSAFPASSKNEVSNTVGSESNGRSRALVLGLFGILLLVALYVRWPEVPERYLWTDEAWRAELIFRTASPRAAIEYAAKEGLIVQLPEWVLGRVGLCLFGKSALAFRIWPLLFAILGLVGVFLFVSTVASPSAALLATFLIACGQGFIQHSREFKPYALDFALTVWTLYAVVRVPQSKQGRHDVFLCALLHLFALSSLVFAFVFPAVVLERISRRRVSSRFEWFTLLSPLVVFLLLFVLFLRPQQLTWVVGYWQHYYANSVANLQFLAGAVPKFLNLYFLPGWIVGTLSFFVVFPLLAIWHRERLGLLLLTPFLVQLILSALGRYPILDRPSYYLYGLVVIAFALAVNASIRLLIRRWPTHQNHVETGVILTLIGYLLVNGSVTQHISLGMQWPPQQGGEAFERLAQEFRPGDHLLFGRGTYYTFLFYKDSAFSSNPALLVQRLRKKDSLMDRSSAEVCSSLKARGADVRVGDRVFFVTTHQPNAYKHYREVLPRLGKMSILIGELHQSLILLEVTQPPQTLLCS